MAVTKRRTFLKSLTFGAGACAFGRGRLGRLARAQSQEGTRRFVFCYFNGGWDTLMCLDPRDPAVFTEERIGETRIQLGWDRLDPPYQGGIIQAPGSNIPFGPVMGGLASHYDKCCVVNGISMDTVTHEVGRRYFITGMMPRGLTAAGSAIGTRIVAQEAAAAERPIPNLATRVETYNEGLPAFASALKVSSVGDLQLVLMDLPTAPTGLTRTRLDEYRAKGLVCDPTQLDRRGFLALIGETQGKARELVAQNLSSLFKFDSGTDPAMKAIAQRYAGADQISDMSSPEAQAAAAYQAIRYDVAQCVSIELASGLDTHDDAWATDHPGLLAQGFDTLGVLVDDLASTPSEDGGSLLDHTTILVFSEFGRTAMINNRDGRDHSLANSALLIGAGVPGNRIVGATTDVGLGPRAIDPCSGLAVESGGTVLTPTLVIASLMASAGYDTDDLRVDGLPCLMDGEGCS